jgi:hypothetical protein
MLWCFASLLRRLIVLQFKRNPYYQYFCGYPNYTPDVPCNATELVHFRKRIGIGFIVINQFVVWFLRVD